VSRPLLSLAQATDLIGAGDHNAKVPATERVDEIGVLARSVEILRKEAKSAEKLQRDREGELVLNEQTAKAQVALVEEFNAQVVEVVAKLIGDGTTLESDSTDMSAVADRTGREVTAVASASEQADANLQTVAAASEELSASSREIASQVHRASGIAKNAASQATTTDQMVRGLA